MTATKEEVIAFMKSEFPQSKCVVEAVSNVSPGPYKRE